MKYVLAFFGVAVIVIAMMLLLFNRPNPDTAKAKLPINLTEYIETGATAVYTVDGAINAEEQHRVIRIKVNRNIRTIEVLSGYNENVIKSQDFPNTQSAYKEFLYALKNAGFARRQETVLKQEDGVCPLGKRYIYELREFDDEIERLWSTSCAKKDGTFGGSAALVGQLFQRQIPEYNVFVRGIQI